MVPAPPPEVPGPAPGRCWFCSQGADALIAPPSQGPVHPPGAPEGLAQGSTAQSSQARGLWGDPGAVPELLRSWGYSGSGFPQNGTAGMGGLELGPQGGERGAEAVAGWTWWGHEHQ